MAGPKTSQGDRVDVVREDDAMRVAHGQAGDGEALPRRLQGLLHRLAPLPQHGDGGAVNSGRPMSTLNPPPSSGGIRSTSLPPARVSIHMGLAVTMPFSGEVGGQAADPVAAHLRLRAVGVVDDHARVPGRGRPLRQDDPVRPHARPPGAQGGDQADGKRPVRALVKRSTMMKSFPSPWYFTKSKSGLLTLEIRVDAGSYVSGRDARVRTVRPVRG